MIWMWAGMLEMKGECRWWLQCSNFVKHFQFSTFLFSQFPSQLSCLYSYCKSKLFHKPKILFQFITWYSNKSNFISIAHHMISFEMLHFRHFVSPSHTTKYRISVVLNAFIQIKWAVQLVSQQWNVFYWIIEVGVVNVAEFLTQVLAATRQYDSKCSKIKLKLYNSVK